MKKSFLTLAVLLSMFSMIRADLHDPNNAADYLIISPQYVIDENDWLNELAQWRNDHGRTAMVIPLEQIFFDFGGELMPEDSCLRLFLHYAYLNWQEPQLKDVFIVGYCDLVPCHYVSSNFIHYDVPSDLYYVFNDDESDLLFSVGRFPWSPESGDTLSNYYEKVVAYETAEEGPWQTRVHLIADSSFLPWDFVNDFAEPLTEFVPNSFEIERDYFDFEAGHPWHGDREEVLENLDAGSLITTYVGHGASHTWAPYMNLDSTSFSALTNGERLTIYVGIGYDYNSTPPLPGEILSSILSNPNGGAIAYFGGTIGWAQAGIYYREAWYDTMFGDSVATTGDVWYQTALRFVSDSMRFQGATEEFVRMMILYGDPGVQLPASVSPVEEVGSAVLPESVRLIGNYPNPFNSSTTIRYELSAQEYITLSIVDLLGRETIRLADEVTTAGVHDVTWNAENVASGIYFAMLKTETSVKTLKLVYLK